MYVVITVSREQFREAEKELQRLGWKWAGEEKSINLMDEESFPTYDNVHILAHNALLTAATENGKVLQFAGSSDTNDSILESSAANYVYENVDTIKVALTTLMLL